MEDLKQPVDNHAEAVEQIMKIWITWLRKLDVPIFFFALPNSPNSGRATTDPSEFDPKNLIDLVGVTQDSSTASDRVVLQQAGLELRNAGAIDDREMYEVYFRAQDPDAAINRKYIQMVVDHVVTGTQAAPGSLIAMVVEAVRGHVIYDAPNRVPNLAVSLAEQMAQGAQQQGPDREHSTTEAGQRR